MALFVCCWVSFFSLSISSSLTLDSRSRSPFMPPAHLSSFWFNLPSCLCHYLCFIYYSLLLSLVQLPFSLFSSPSTATPLLSLALSLSLSLSLSKALSWQHMIIVVVTHLSFSLFTVVSFSNRLHDSFTHCCSADETPEVYKRMYYVIRIKREW